VSIFETPERELCLESGGDVAVSSSYWAASEMRVLNGIVALIEITRGRVEWHWHVGCIIEEHAEKNCVGKVSGRDAACIEKAY
jgi:hypothetical protein